MARVQSNMNGARLLAELRHRAGVSQAELARRAEVSRSMVAQLEMGERKPSQKLIRALCQAMNASEEDERQLLLAYEFRPTGDAPDQIAALLRADKNLTSEQAERLVEIIRQVYEAELAREQTGG